MILHWDYFLITARKGFFIEMSAKALTYGCRKKMSYPETCL